MYKDTLKYVKLNDFPFPLRKKTPKVAFGVPIYDYNVYYIKMYFNTNNPARMYIPRLIFRNLPLKRLIIT